MKIKREPRPPVMLVKGAAGVLRLSPGADGSCLGTEPPLASTALLALSRRLIPIWIITCTMQFLESSPALLLPLQLSF